MTSLDSLSDSASGRLEGGDPAQSVNHTGMISQTVNDWNRKPIVKIPGRVCSEREYAALRAAVRRLIRHAGGLKVLAANPSVCRQKSVLSDWQNRNGRRFPPLDVVADLERITGRPFVSAVLAKIGGWRVAARSPEPSGTMRESFFAAGRASAQVHLCLAEYLEVNDGHVDTETLKRWQAESERAIERLSELNALLSRALE